MSIAIALVLPYFAPAISCLPVPELAHYSCNAQPFPPQRSGGGFLTQELADANIEAAGKKKLTSFGLGAFESGCRRPSISEELGSRQGQRKRWEDSP